MANEPRQLNVGSESSNETTYVSGGTSEANVGTNPQVLGSQPNNNDNNVYQGQEQGQAQVSTEARVLDKVSESTTETVKGESGVGSVSVGTEAKEISKSEENTNVNQTNIKAVVNDTKRALRVSEEQPKGEYVVQTERLGGFERSAGEKSVVNTITVEEVKALIKKYGGTADAYTKSETDDLLDEKQDLLVSGKNIKTINGQSILGEGNIEINLSNYYTKTETETKIIDYLKTFITDGYNENSNYSAGDLVIEDGKLYQAKQDITAETFDPSHWQQINISQLLDKKVNFVNLKIDCLAPVGDSTTLSGISVQVKDAQDQVIATGTYNGTTLTFALPLNQTYKVKILTDSLTISGITYFAPEIVSGSSEGTLTNETTLTYRYSSTEHITSLSGVKQFLALQGIDIATKRLALVRSETNQFSVDIVIKNPANNTEYTMPLYILEVDNYTKLVEGVEQTFVGARVEFAYALPDSVPFDQREQVECASGETFQEGTYYYTATSTGIGDKTFTPLTAGTDYQNGDDIDTYKSTNNVYVFKHAWSNTQYGSGNKSTANLIRYGCNIFHKSNLFKWLNASGDDWFVADHLGDTISGSWFEGKKGFKDWLKSTDLALIEQDVAYGVYEIDNATLPNNKVYAQFVVPSGTEIAGSVNNNEGTVFDYWKYLNGGQISNSANANRTVVKVSNLTSKQTTWLRSPYRNYSYSAWRVTSSGGVTNLNACNTYAVLPLFTI